VWGLSAALSGRITIRNGQVEQSNFHDYPVLRMSEMPQLDIHLVDSRAAPGGIGEPCAPPVAPAVANALFAASGVRIRELPFPSKVTAGTTRQRA
jgi:isoquinoline 1-oxidoreductase subunit beta